MILQLGTWDFEGSPSHLAIAGMYWTYSLLGVQKLGYFEAFGKSLYMTVAKKKLFFWYGETSLKPYEAQHFLMVNSPFASETPRPEALHGGVRSRQLGAPVLARGPGRPGVFRTGGTMVITMAWARDTLW